MTIAAAGTNVDNDDTDTSSISVSHTLVSGSDRIVLVSLGVGDTNDDGEQTVSVTYGGESMTLIGQRFGEDGGGGFGSGNNEWAIYLFGILDADLPSDGANTISASWTDTSSSARIFAAQYTGVDQSVPTGDDLNEDDEPVLNGDEIEVMTPNDAVAGDLVYYSQMEGTGSSRTYTFGGTETPTELYNTSSNRTLVVAELIASGTVTSFTSEPNAICYGRSWITARLQPAGAGPTTVDITAGTTSLSLTASGSLEVVALGSGTANLGALASGSVEVIKPVTGTANLALAATGTVTPIIAVSGVQALGLSAGGPGQVIDESITGGVALTLVASGSLQIVLPGIVEISGSAVLDLQAGGSSEILVEQTGSLAIALVADGSLEIVSEAVIEITGGLDLPIVVSGPVEIIKTGSGLVNLALAAVGSAEVLVEINGSTSLDLLSGGEVGTNIEIAGSLVLALTTNGEIETFSTIPQLTTYVTLQDQNRTRGLVQETGTWVVMLDENRTSILIDREVD